MNLPAPASGRLPACPRGGWRAGRGLLFAPLLMLALFVSGAGAGAATRANARSRQGPGSAGAVVIYRRVFKSSSPEFIEVRIPEQGPGSCDQRNLDDPPDPQSVEIGSALRARIFALAGELNYFRGITLDVQRRIAYLGEKTFRYERGSESNEVKFNYTLNSKASQLLQLFDGLAREQDEITILARRMKYDRLGVNDALLQIDDDIHHQVLVQPERFLPLLEQIAGDERFLDIARKRARALADYIRSSGH